MTSSTAASYQPHLLPRLWLPQPCASACQLNLNESQHHYLKNVLRLSVGDALRVFNGTNGEWLAKITTQTKQQTSLTCQSLLRVPVAAALQLNLAFALIRPARQEILLEKATELGAHTLQPLQTERTQYPPPNHARLEKIIIEATEQSEQMQPPTLHPTQKLNSWLPTQQAPILFCAEVGSATPISTCLQQLANHPLPALTLLIGPEGGFSATEQSLLRAHAGCLPISLGSTILRAETAAFAALSCVQAQLGAWRTARD